MKCPGCGVRTTPATQWHCGCGDQPPVCLTQVALHASPGAFGSAEALLARVDAALGKAKS